MTYHLARMARELYANYSFYSDMPIEDRLQAPLRSFKISISKLKDMYALAWPIFNQPFGRYASRHHI